jgi:hypothetical protein
MGLAQTGSAAPKYVPVADSLLRATRNNRKLMTAAGNNLAGNMASNLANKLAGNKKSSDGKKKDSTHNKPDLSMSAGLSLAHTFPMPGQLSASYSSNGKSNVLPDYLPAPYFRSYVGDRWYLQIAPRLYSPQYVKPQRIDSLARDSSRIPGFSAYFQKTDVTLKKLFYMDIPLSLHYRVAGRLYLGAGIQYSHLLGAAGEEKITMSPINGGADTIYSDKVVGLKNDTLGYRKLSRSEWRLFLETNYQWRRWTLGLRYEQALKTYLPTQIDGTKSTERNASFSIHVYYDLWERSHKKN